MRSVFAVNPIEKMLAISIREGSFITYPSKSTPYIVSNNSKEDKGE